VKDHHIGPHRIFELSQLETAEIVFHMTEWEKEHLRECDECQRILAVFARQFDSERPPHDRRGNSASEV